MKGASEEPVTTTRTFMFGRFGSVTGNAAIVAAGIHLCALAGLVGASAYFWPFKCAGLVNGGLWTVSCTRQKIIRDGVPEENPPWVFGKYNLLVQAGLTGSSTALLWTSYRYVTLPSTVAMLCAMPLISLLRVYKFKAEAVSNTGEKKE